MSHKPLIHKYHFSDIRESILSSIQSLFNIDDLVNVVPNKQTRFIATKITDADKQACEICLVHIENGVLIHTSFTKQKDVHDRLWVIDPFLGRVSYIEITNPDLKTININKFFDKTDENIEMYAWPDDLNLLNTLLITTLTQAKQGKIKPIKLNDSTKNLLAI